MRSIINSVRKINYYIDSKLILTNELVIKNLIRYRGGIMKGFMTKLFVDDSLKIL